MKRYTRVARAVVTQPWVINPRSHQWAMISSLIARRMAGEPLTDEEIDARLAEEQVPSDWQDRLEPFGAAQAEAGVLGRVGAMRVPVAGVRPGSYGADSRQSYIAVLPVHGVLLPRVGSMERMSGATSVSDMRAAFSAAVRDEDAAAIVLDFDSPGGLVDLIPEFGEQIRAARGTKPIIGVADTMAASAGYWLLAQAEEVSVTPSGEVGSIGVFSAHDDLSKFYEELGLDRTFIKYGENKTQGNEFEPLSEHARERMQATVDTFGRMFDQAVADGRGVKASLVHDSWGQGDMFPAAEALELGMVDRIESLEDALLRLSGDLAEQGGSGAAARAEIERTKAAIAQREVERVKRAIAARRDRRQPPAA